MLTPCASRGCLARSSYASRKLKPTGFHTPSSWKLFSRTKSTCESSAQSFGATKLPTSAFFRSLDNFDFAFNPSIDRARIYELAACHFIRQQRDALLIGPPGVGKSHLAQAIGVEAIKAGFLVLY